MLQQIKRFTPVNEGKVRKRGGVAQPYTCQPQQKDLDSIIHAQIWTERFYCLKMIRSHHIAESSAFGRWRRLLILSFSLLVEILLESFDFLFLISLHAECQQSYANRMMMPSTISKMKKSIPVHNMLARGALTVNCISCKTKVF